MVKNFHKRTLYCSMEKASPLIDQLASSRELLWPNERWPAIQFDRPLAVGAKGGHGPIRYEIEAYEPGHFIRFRFIKPKGFMGMHEFRVEELSPHRVIISHQLAMQLRGFSRLSWPFVIRWLHDALIEEAFDKAEEYATGQAVQKREWPSYIKVLRKLAAKL